MIFSMTLQLLKMTSTTSSLFSQDAFGIGGMPTLTSRMNRKVGIWEKQHPKQDRKCRLKTMFSSTFKVYVSLHFCFWNFDETLHAKYKPFD